MFILLFLNLFVYTTIIASLGATTFIIFTMPSAYSAKTKNILGGYTVGIISGIIFNSMSLVLVDKIDMINLSMLYMITGALSVGITIFVMAITNTEHPPAVGMALSLILTPWNYQSLLYVFISILLMILVKRLLRRWLIDLQ
ncbi:HPP family protein [Clostridium sp. D2Q-11]|uniref:HPP family protein n=2 Tax=Anaeromonas frigoriresistens TaxID=2683708 RepID=A0A942V0J2_9FIRM|nr:HPP family protein [Anaeromonas frigoriresistens]MBS4539671.1 HPP family protein [Anaeromonas frigoriresistens]